MRILMIHNEYGARGGEEDAVEALATLLTEHGHRVCWFRRSSCEIAGSLGGKAKAFFAGIHNPFAADSLAATLDEIRPDVVQVQNIYPLLSPAIFGPMRERGLPVVMRCSNYRLFCPNGLHLIGGQVCERCLSTGGELWCVLRNCEGEVLKSTGYALRNAWARISRRILNGVDIFIVQTRFQKEKFVARGIPEGRIGIVPGLVPYQEAAERSGTGDLVSYVGRISPEKGIEDFLAAAACLPRVPFAVAGSGNGMEALRRRSPANVCWLGFVQAAELRQLYLKSRIVVVPSRCYEGFPNVIVQAMACGCPVVGARIGAMTDIIDHGETGLLFEPGDPEDLARILEFLYGDQELCRTLGRAGEEKVSTQYSRESVYAALMTVYEEARFCCHR